MISVLNRLPGIGRRTSERIAFMLANDKKGTVKLLSDTLKKLDENIIFCEICGIITDKNNNPCLICSDPSRMNGVICVVETSEEVYKIESSKSFNGRYHVLTGKISPLSGYGVNDLRINELIKRINSENINEIIFALDEDIESMATINYLAEQLADYKIKLTRINSNLFNEYSIEYVNTDLLGEALIKRIPFK